MKGTRWLSAALALTMTVSLSAAPAAAATFTDLNGHWAKADVEYLSSLGLVSGYNDGTFKPDAAMSAVEALLFCARVTGIDSATKTKIAQAWEDTLKEIVPADMLTWAGPDLAVCLETGIITSAELKALANGSGLLNAIHREKVALYLARAMQIDGAAESLTEYELTFADQDSISRDLRPYVYLLTDYGILKGDELNRFLPKSSVNRASMTSLMRRAMDFMKEKGITVELADYTTYDWVGGTITSTSVSSGGTTVLTIQSPLSGARTLTLPAGGTIYENNMKSTGGALKNGSYARVKLNSSGTPTAVWVSGALETLSGSVSDMEGHTVTVQTGSGVRDFRADRFTEVQVGNGTGGVELLDDGAGYARAECMVDAQGHLAALRLTGGTRQENGLLSEVKSNSDGSYTVQVTSMSGVKTRYTVPSGAGVTINGAVGKLSTGHVGDYVTLRVSNDEVSTVSALNVDTASDYVQGSIRSVSYSQTPGKLTINEFKSGKSVTYTVASGAVITYDGKATTLSKLEKNAYVTLRLSGTEAAEVLAYPGSSTEEGVITSITYGSPMVMEVTRADGQVLTFDIDLTDPPEVYRNDARSSIDRLKNGDSVVVTVRYQEVSSIDATPQSANASGIIQKVTMDTSGTLIEVALSDGGTASYRVSAGVSVTQDGKAVSIDSLKPGYQIAMVLDGDQILSIEVDKSAVSSNQIDGTVLYVNSTSEEMLIQRRGEDQSVITVDVSDAQLLSVTGGELSLRQFETNQNVTIYGSYDGLTFRATLVIRT